MPYIQLHDKPHIFLYCPDGTEQIGPTVERFFIEFCLKTNPLPFLRGQNLRETTRLIKNYYNSFFGEGRHLMVRQEGGKITGFALLDPWGRSLDEPRDMGNTSELVIAGTCDSNIWAAKRDLLTALNFYKKRYGFESVICNINRADRLNNFIKYVEKVLNFKKIDKNLYSF